MNFINNKFILNLRRSKMFKDSFWAVFGNGIGYGLLLLSGILIARFLGKDLYGEYGLVKTTMFTIAAFSTFGLGYTSTKFVADYIISNRENVYAITKASLVITLVSSSFLALLLIFSASYVADYLDAPSLKLVFQVLGFIAIVRALLTTANGILAGFKEFKIIAKNNVISGGVMLVTALPLAYYFQLKGALTSLALSQVLNTLLNCLALKNICKDYSKVKNNTLYKKLLRFSFPVALQEFSYAVVSWLSPILLVKYSNMGELGIYSAAAQWNAIILFIPGLLYNVVLSYLSSSVNDEISHSKIINRMILVNLLSTLIPFILVYFCADFISSFYGATFSSMSIVLNYCVFSTLFSACSQVFQSEFIAQGFNWALFVLRLIRDVLGLFLIFLLLNVYREESGAKLVAIAGVITSSIYFGILFISYKILRKYEAK